MMLDTHEIIKYIILMKKASINQKLTIIRDLSRSIEQELEQSKDGKDNERI